MLGKKGQFIMVGWFTCKGLECASTHQTFEQCCYLQIMILAPGARINILDSSKDDFNIFWYTIKLTWSHEIVFNKINCFISSEKKKKAYLILFVDTN